MRKLLYILCLSLSLYHVKAQTVFNNVYNDFTHVLIDNVNNTSSYNNDFFGACFQRLNGNYLSLGYSRNGFSQIDSFKFSAYLVETLPTGDTLMNLLVEYEKYALNGFIDIIELQDSSIYLFGVSNGNVYDTIPSNDEGLLIKYDKNFNLLWSRKGFDIGKQENLQRAAYVENENLFYVIVSAHRDSLNNDYDSYISTIDTSGNLIHVHQFGGYKNDFANDFEQLDDGTFILSGTTYSNTVGTLGRTDIYVLCVDTLGNVLWEKNYGYPGWDDANGSKNLFIRNNEIYIAGRHEKSDGNDVGWLLKLNLQGDTVWTKMFDRGEEYDGFRAIQQWGDSSFLLMGSSIQYEVAPAYKPACWLLKIDLSGNIIWERIISRYPTEDDADTYPFDMTLASDGGILLSGYVINQSIQTNGIFHRNDAWFAKTDSCGFTVGAEPQALLTIDSVVGAQVYISNLSQEYCIANMEIALYDSITGDTTHLDSLNIYAYSQYTNGENPNQLVYTLPDTGTYIFSLTTYAGDGMDSFSTSISVSDISTGILSNTLDHDFDWNIYPNPTKEYIIVSYSPSPEERGLGGEASLSLEVLNLTGQVVHSKILIPNQLQQKMLLPELNNGVYLVRLLSNQQVIGVKKLVII